MKEDWAITIIDPFDCTYNPARHIKKEKRNHRDYLKYFKESAKNLENGLPLNLLIVNH